MFTASAGSPYMRWPITVGVLLIVVLSSCTTPPPEVPRPSPRVSPTPAASVSTITTAVATRSTISASPTYSGTVRARSQVSVVSTVGGRLGRTMTDLGDEVREGDVIAELERGAFDSQVQQAEAAVRAAQAHFNQVQAGARPEDIQAAQASVRAAQARLEEAQSGARPEEVAAAGAQVDQAQAKLDALLAGPKPDDAAGLDAAVEEARGYVEENRALLSFAMASQTEARFRLEQARAGLGGPNTRAEDIAAAQAALNAAKSRLDNLRAGPRPEEVRAAELWLTRAQANLKAGRAALEACGNSPTTTRTRTNVISPNIGTNNNDNLETVTRERVSCARSQRVVLEQQRIAAEVAVQEAQNTLDLVRNGASPFEIQQAEEAVRQAEATLQKTRFGGTTDLAALELRVGAVQADVERIQGILKQAQAKLEAAQSRADSARNASAFDVRNAQAVINQAAANMARLVNPNPFDVEAARAGVAQAQAALQARQNPVAEDVEIAAAQVEQAVAALDAARFNQGETVIRAPFDGIVVQRLVSPGAAVGPNTPIVTIVSRAVDVVIQVEEARINQIRRDQPGQITAQAFPGETFPGVVTGIAPGVDTLSRTIGVRVTPAERADRFRDGMAAQVMFDPTERQALLVPAQAVINRTGRTIVFVLTADSRVAVRDVQVGATDGQRVEIVSGLSEGDEVATSGQDQLSDGMQVQATRQP